MKASTKVLSARIPVDVMATIDTICKNKGQTRSQFVTSMVAEQQSNNFYEKGGSIQTRTIPKELQEILIGAGVATIGIGTYSLLNKTLATVVDEDGNSKFTSGEIEFISIASALTIALAGHGLIRALIK